MEKWLPTKIRNFRLRTYAAMLMTMVRRASAPEQARILLWGQNFRASFVKDHVFSHCYAEAAMDDPQSGPKEDVLLVFYEIERIRQFWCDRYKEDVKMMKDQGVNETPSMKSMYIAHLCSMDMWISILACAIVPSIAKNVRSYWEYMDPDDEMLRKAIENELTCDSRNLPFGFDPFLKPGYKSVSEGLELCRYVPTIVKNLRLVRRSE